MNTRKKLSLAAQIFIALGLGIIAGLLFLAFGRADIAINYVRPIGTVFLNLIKFIVVPIVLSSIICGVISMKDIHKVESIGIKTLLYYMLTTSLAIAIGLFVANGFKGFFHTLGTADLSYEVAEKSSFMDTLVGIFPSNIISPMLEAFLSAESTQAVQSTSRPTQIPSGTRSNETTRLRSRQSSKTLTKPLSKWMSLKKCKSFASSASAKPSRDAQAPFQVWCTVPIAARSCTTELPTMASERERSSIVRFIGSTRTSAEHTLSESLCWSEWC